MKLIRYDIHENPGKGGFGTVCKAEDQVLGRVIALTEQLPQLTVGPKFTGDLTRT